MVRLEIMNLVFDTSLLIDNLRGGDRLEKILENIPSKKRLYIPTIAITEIFSGTSTRSEKVVKNIKKLISQFERVPLSESIAEKAGELYRDSVVKAEMADYIIAATTIDLAGYIVTLNKKHFKQIKGVYIFETN